MGKAKFSDKIENGDVWGKRYRAVEPYSYMKEK